MTAETIVAVMPQSRRQFCQPSPWKPVKAAKAVIFR